jgi:plastocyanin
MTSGATQAGDHRGRGTNTKRVATARGAIAIAIAFLLLAAACSGKSNSASKSTDSTGSNSGSAPVKLAGQVTDHGTKDITSSGMSATVALEADDFYFSPTFIKATPGATVTVQLKNEGSMEHTFTAPTAGIDQTLQPDQAKTVTVRVPTSGSLAFYCRFHKSSGMQGAFFTAPAGGTGAGTTATTPSTAASQGSSSGY